MTDISTPSAQCQDCQNILPFHTCGNCEADFQTDDKDRLLAHLCTSCFNQDMFLHKI